jgi:hypothetical protein
MNKNQRILVSLLNCSIRGEKHSGTNHYNINWNYIASESMEHQIYPLLYPVIKDISSPQHISCELKETWKINTIKTALYLNMQILQLSKVFQSFNDTGVPVIALKGLILRNLYPNPDLRTMGDADILVHKEDLDKVRTILTQMDYIETKEPTPAHIAFVHKKYCPIEVHWTLADDRYLGAISNFEETVWDRAVEIKIGSASVLCLCTEDFLMHLCIHMAVHMRSGGFGLRQLCDLVLFVENSMPQLDWAYFCKSIKQNGIEKFTAAIFRVCNILFNLEIPQKLKKLPVEYKYVKMLIKDIFDSGVFGMKSLDRLFGNNLLNADIIFKDSNSTKINNVLKLICPPVNMLPEGYSYAKKYKILIPAAWIHHFFAGIFHKDYDITDKLNFLLFSTHTFKKRAELLKNLEL